jgi:hypothetical protein
MRKPLRQQEQPDTHYYGRGGGVCDETPSSTGLRTTHLTGTAQQISGSQGKGARGVLKPTPGIPHPVATVLASINVRSKPGVIVGTGAILGESE